MDCPCGFDPSVQRLTVGGASVGVAGLGDIFRSWMARDKKADDLTKEQIVREIGKLNYIVPRLEEEYAAAIRPLYASYCAERARA
jgi:hypothetical protein